MGFKAFIHYLDKGKYLNKYITFQSILKKILFIQIVKFASGFKSNYQFEY